MTKISVEGFRNFFKYYSGEEHQIRAIDELYLDIDTDLLQDSSTWIKMYRTPNAPPVVVEPDIPISLSNPLDVPYEYQLDNESGTGYRECFSSSCAMVARYYGRVRGDDDYNLIRAQFGDSTDPQAHARALRALQQDICRAPAGALQISLATTTLAGGCMTPTVRLTSSMVAMSATAFTQV